MLAVEVLPISGLIRDIGADRIEEDTRDPLVAGEPYSYTVCAGRSTWWELIVLFHTCTLLYSIAALVNCITMVYRYTNTV